MRNFLEIFLVRPGFYHYDDASGYQFFFFELLNYPEHLALGSKSVPISLIA
jgi:hypothetical protein